MNVPTVAGTLMLWLAGTGAQGIPPGEIAAAIEEGRAGKTLHKKCGASGENGFEIVVEGPIGRIMRATREARRQDRQFTVGDVTPAMAGPFLTVSVRRDPTLTSANAAVQMKEAPGVWVLPDTVSEERRRSLSTMGYSYRTDVVLRSRPPRSEAPVVLRPVGRTADAREAGGRAWTYPSGTPRTGPPSAGDWTASFDLAAFRAIPHRDIDVVIFMTDAGEHRCKISEEDRRHIR